MTALIIIAAVILLFILIGFIRIRFLIDCPDSTMTLTVKILFFRFRVYPKPAPRVKLRNFTYANFAKRLEKEKKKRAKLLAKRSKKAAKKAEKAPKKQMSASDVINILRDASKALPVLIKKFFRHLRIDLSCLDITVGGEDAAAVAVSYGVVSQLVSYILSLLDGITTLKTADSSISVKADFLAPKTTAAIRIDLSLSVGGLLDTAVSSVYNYLKANLFRRAGGA